MKFLLKFLLIIFVLFVSLIVAIKYIAKCSWKDAFGIVEQLVKEMKDSCGVCGEHEE